MEILIACEFIFRLSRWIVFLEIRSRDLGITDIIKFLVSDKLLPYLQQHSRSHVFSTNRTFNKKTSNAVFLEEFDKNQSKIETSHFQRHVITENAPFNIITQFVWKQFSPSLFV